MNERMKSQQSKSQSNKDQSKTANTSESRAVNTTQKSNDMSISDIDTIQESLDKSSMSTFKGFVTDLKDLYNDVKSLDKRINLKEPHKISGADMQEIKDIIYEQGEKNKNVFRNVSDEILDKIAYYTASYLDEKYSRQNLIKDLNQKIN